MMLKFLIDLEPMATTNRNMIILVKGRPMVIKTKEARVWMERAVAQLQVQRMQQKIRTIEGPVAMSMDVWRVRNAGDLGNFYKGVEDALQEARIVRNDKQIVEHRHCRVLTDPKRPRYEITLFILESQGVLMPLEQ